MKEVDQDYIDESTAELNYFVQEAGSRLNSFVKGEATEDELHEIAGRAVSAYEELEDGIEKATEQLQDYDAAEDLRSSVEDAGYDSMTDFLVGNKPPRASGKDPGREALDNFLHEDYVDVDDASEAMSAYMDLASDVLENYGVELPLPELGEKGKQVEEDLEKVEELMEEEEISAEEAIDRIDFL